MSKKMFLVVLSLLFAVSTANAYIIVDDDCEAEGDAIADFAGEIVTPWTGIGGQSVAYWRMSSFIDEEPGVGIDGDLLPLEVVNGSVVGIMNYNGSSPQTASVTYAGVVERGVYTMRLQVGHISWRGALQADQIEVTLGGMQPTSTYISRNPR